VTEHAFDLESVVHGRVGTIVVGKYHLDRVIGIGGMAAVYAATHRNQAEFAVKMLHADVSSRDDLRSRFLREGYIANSVKHPGAVRVVDDDIAEDGSAFLVMELLDGRSVEDLWFQSDRHIPLRFALGIAHQLLDVLAAAHAKSIVHRDIKPANLFLTPLGDLKVLDFGIARLRDSTSSHHTTQSGTMLGTPAFMAPEQARGQTKEVEGRTDLWSVGATVFSLVSGQLVHQAGSAPQLLLHAATTPARSLQSVAPEVPAPIVALVDRALAFDKPARWPDAASMRDAVREAFVEAFGEPPTRDALAAYFAEMDGAPVRSTSRPPVPKDGGETPPAVMDSAVATKLEAKGVPKLAKTLPLAQNAPEPAQHPVPARKMPERTLPLGHKSPLSPSAVKEEALATATEPSKQAPPVEPKSATPGASRSRMPLVIGILVVVGLLAGLALLSMRGSDTAPAGASPPAVSALPTPSTAPSAAP
jgi:serine/threonine protein kinase